jgi:hypothetical protein
MLAWSCYFNFLMMHIILLLRNVFFFFLSCLNMLNHGVITYALGIVEKPWMNKGGLKLFCSFLIYYVGDWILNFLNWKFNKLVEIFKNMKQWTLMNIISWKALTFLYFYINNYGQHYILCKVNIYFPLLKMKLMTLR